MKKIAQQLAQFGNKTINSKEYGEEIAIPAANGEHLVFPSYNKNNDGVDYVRFINEEGEELMYWNCDEWAEQPELVMGAILGALLNGAKVGLVQL